LNLSTPAHPRLTLGLCAGLSVGLHAAVALALAFMHEAPLRPAGGAFPAARPSPIEARLVPTPVPATLAASAPQAEPPRHTPAPAPIPAPMPAPTPEPVASALPQNAPLPGLPPLAEGDPQGYLPRPLLSVAPVLTTPVDIPMPSGVDTDTLGARVGVVALYIDETGRVRDVQPQEPRLPPAFEAVVRQAFMDARYVPAQRDGQIVKARIRIEVVFGGRTALPAQAAQAAGTLPD